MEDNSKYNKVDKIKSFGEFRYMDTKGGAIEIEPKWVEENIISYKIPENLQKKFGKKIEINKMAYTKWNKAFTLLSEKIDLLKNIKTYDGTYVPRHKKWNIKKGISNHSWGLAIDINADIYPMGKFVDAKGTPNDIQLELWEKVFKPAGFSWGNSYKDGMHFEIFEP